MFDFGTNRRFLMLAPLDLCLRTGRVIFTLTGTTIDFVPDFLSDRIFLSGFGTRFCSKISAVTVDSVSYTHLASARRDLCKRQRL